MLAAALLALLAAAAWRGETYVPSSAAEWDATAPVRHVQRGRARVALTFDSGWGEDYTQEVLEILKAQGAQAFILGCTELPIAFVDYGFDEVTIDPTQILAEAALRAVGMKVKER